MSRRKSIKIWLLASLLCLLVGFPAGAGTEGGAEPVRNGQTEVQAGVVVDYMGKLRFVVLERNTTIPIPGASVEIYITALNRYVLFGLTDANGIYELDVAYNMDPNTSDSAQFTESNGNYTFTGSPLYLSSNDIRYRVYKAGWLPHPSIGETVLGTTEVPQVITIYLHKPTGGDDGGTPTTPTTPTVIPPGSTPTGKALISSILDTLQSIFDAAVPQGGLSSGGIPRTGVEGAVHYWLLGFVFFLLAGGIVCILLKRDQKPTAGEAPCGYTWMLKKQGKNKEASCGYTWMPKKQGKNKERRD